MNHDVQAPQLPEIGSGAAAMNNPSSPEVGAFTVLKTCPSSASDQEPTLVDHRPLPRSRRRRTSPEDQAVLEAEFQRNPKPDRATRADIVNRVTLGEKEVQIWFQNRRQIARRKSSAPSTYDSSPSIFRNISAVDPGSMGRNIKSQAGQSTDDIKARDFVLQSNSVIPTREEDEGKLDTTKRKLISDGRTTPESPMSRSTMTETSRPSLSDGILQTAGDVSSALTQNSSLSIDETTQETSSACTSGSSGMRPQTLTGLPPLLVKRKSSSLRLSTTFDGKAQIVIDNGSSPPRPPSTVMQKLLRPQQPLQRSQSEISSQTSCTWNLSDSMPVPRRLAPSRSRDARTWEFYCDSDARNALTVQAENEQRGKAETTIGLIRSSSASKMAVSPAVSAAGPTKRKSTSRKPHSRPKLARTESSVARLQSMSSNANLKLENPDALVKKGSPQAMLIVDLPGDLSDKENWIPGTRRRLVRSPRPEAEMRVRSTLRENSEIPSHSNSLESHLERDIGRRSRLQGTPASKEDEEPQDPEVAAFMGEANVPRIAEDLDCVQQLLSLSQGAWS